jgi:hypothetical protein
MATTCPSSTPPTSLLFGSATATMVGSVPWVMMTTRGRLVVDLAGLGHQLGAILHGMSAWPWISAHVLAPLSLPNT